MKAVSLFSWADVVIQYISSHSSAQKGGRNA